MKRLDLPAIEERIAAAPRGRLTLELNADTQDSSLDDPIWDRPWIRPEYYMRLRLDDQDLFLVEGVRSTMATGFHEAVELLLHAYDDIPALVAEVKRLTDRCDALDTMLHRADGLCP